MDDTKQPTPTQTSPEHDTRNIFKEKLTCAPFVPLYPTPDPLAKLLERRRRGKGIQIELFPKCQEMPD